ncbi:MFS transporter [Mangrovicoccus sp. HB161399]|uniref:MFS transporter n=1 Tax=Mangrovicoccus sp. HB161399 TaxID=2720392 RepID=UPI001C12F3B3|nr:MFS transporter [Mangrovicoccus sp. HB161399]
MSAWLVLAVTLGLQAAISAAALTMPVLAPAAAASFGLQAVQIGLYVGLVYAGAMASSLASGTIIRRYGAIRTSQVALLLAAAGLLLGLSGMAWLLVPGALVIGFGYGTVTPASSHMLARSAPAGRMGLVFSLKQTGVPLGGAIAGLLLPPVAGHGGWHWGVALSAAICLAAAALAQPLQPALDADRDPAAQPSRAPLFAPLRNILSRPALRDLAAASFVFAAMQLVLTSYLVTFLSGERGLSLGTAGAVMAMSQAAGIAGRLAWGWMADRLVGPRLLLCLLAAAMAGCALAFALSGSGWPVAVLILASILFGATAIGWNGVFLAEVARLVPREEAGAATGGALFMTYGGVIAGPPIFAFLIGHGGYGSAFLAFSLALAGLAVFLARSPAALHTSRS